MKSFAALPLREKIRRVHPDAPVKFIFIDTARQRLHLIDDTVPVRSFTISTSRFGTGNREGSNRTPLGMHRIVAKIGSGAPPGRIFRDRRDTGTNVQGELTEENIIVTRILRLEGLEDGVNRGPGIDSFKRYIYIHGTNRESSVGTPFSHGCVCMRSNDIIELFDAVREGTIVVID
ncbi:MAG: L,D-transpeptidase [Chitinispirillaceae bacterium]|nr:L,D-transpeptidase [Chitinispirillaceae bacterium]